MNIGGKKWTTSTFVIFHVSFFYKQQNEVILQVNIFHLVGYSL